MIPDSDDEQGLYSIDQLADGTYSEFIKDQRDDLTKAQIARAIRNFYIRKINILLDQAQKGHLKNKPLAVHIRLLHIEAYFQIVVQMEREKGIDECLAVEDQEPIKNLWGEDLHIYYHPESVTNIIRTNNVRDTGEFFSSKLQLLTELKTRLSYLENTLKTLPKRGPRKARVQKDLEFFSKLRAEIGGTNEKK